MNVNNNAILRKIAGFFKGKGEVRGSIMAKDINLMPKDILERRRMDRMFRRAFLLFIELFLLVCLLLAIPFSMYHSANKTKGDLEDKIASLAEIEEIEAELAQMRTSLKNQQKIVADIAASDSAVSVVIKTMEKVMPKSVFLTSLSFSREKDKSAEHIEILGVSKDKKSVADFQKSLKESGFYSDVFVVSLTEQNAAQSNTVTVTETDEAGQRHDVVRTLQIGFKANYAFVIKCTLHQWEGGE